MKEQRQVEGNGLPTNSSDSYLMSFGTGGLYINESAAIAAMHQPELTWDETAVLARKAGAFPVRKDSSAKRTIREIVHRLRCLDENELRLLVDGLRDDQQALLWLAACRAYRFIGEFAEEVVVDNFKAYRADLSYDDFDAFLVRKAETVEKLAEISDTTRVKLRAVLFRLMREAGILTADDRIVGSLLSIRMRDLIERKGEKELRFFPGA